MGAVDHLIKSTDRISIADNGPSRDNLSLKIAGRTSIVNRYGPWIAAFAIGTPLFAADKNIKKFSQRRSIHSKAADNFFRSIHEFGQGYEFALAVPFLVDGMITKNNKTMAVGGELLAGLAVVATTTEVFKLSFGRLRPYQSQSPYRFLKGGRSFFSGDVSTTMTFATIIAKNYPRQYFGFIGIHRHIPLLPILLYSIPTLVACQRLYSDNHWSSDVYFGGLAGYAVGTAVVCYGKKIHLSGFSFTSGRSNVLAACFSFN